MKKLISIIIATSVIFTASLTYSVSRIKEAYFNEQIKINVNGEYINSIPVTVTEEGQQYGRNYVSAADIASALGAEVEWDGQSKTINIRQKKEPTVNDVVEKVKEGCVLIRVYDENNNLIGVASGIAYDKYIITCKHVLIGKKYGITYDYMDFDKGIIVDEVIKADTNIDIGFLKSPYDPKTIKIGDSSKVKIGESIVTISSPKGLINTIEQGIVSALRNTKEGYHIQSNAKTYPGSSGGGVFNMNGELIGIVTGDIDGHNELSIALAASEVREVLSKLK